MKQPMPDKHLQLKSLPGVDHILALAETNDQFKQMPRSLVLESVRRAIDNTRKEILGDKPAVITDEAIINRAAMLAAQKMKNPAESVDQCHRCCVAHQSWQGPALPGCPGQYHGRRVLLFQS